MTILFSGSYRSLWLQASVRLRCHRPRRGPSAPSEWSPAWAWSGPHWSLRPSRDQNNVKNQIRMRITLIKGRSVSVAHQDQVVRLYRVPDGRSFLGPTCTELRLRWWRRCRCCHRRCAPRASRPASRKTPQSSSARPNTCQTKQLRLIHWSTP